jgi:uncharacterized protein
MNRSEIEKKCTGREQRTIVTELRASDEFAILGTAARYGVMSNNLGFREIIQKGAFSRSLRQNPNVVCLWNHDSNSIPLGRTKAGTLTLSEDDRGLHYKCQLDPNNPVHKALHSSIRRGDVESCSFAFSVVPGGQKWEEDFIDPETKQRTLLRTLTDIDIWDVSPVVSPAYPGTNLDARNKNGANPADEAQRIIFLRKAARSMAGIFKRKAPYPAPYDYRDVCKTYDDAMVHAESALARCEDVDSTFDAWDATDEDRCKHSDHKDLREAHANARASLESAAQSLGVARMALARCIGK